MGIEQVITFIQDKTSRALQNQSPLLMNLLVKSGVEEKSRPKLLESILKITRLTDNPKTREAFVRSDFRVYEQGINKDGRSGVLVVEITKECNKSCDICYSQSDGGEVMDTSILYQTIDWARTNYKWVFYTGGEPTLDARVISIAEENPDMVFFMLTNGSLLNEAYTDKLSGLGNLIPCLSINGTSAQTHDYLKSKGSFDETIRAREILHQKGVPWAFTSLVTSTTAQEIFSKEFIKENRNKGAIMVVYLEFIPCGPNPNPDLIPSSEALYQNELVKNLILDEDELYIQHVIPGKCRGFLTIDVLGNIKNCTAVHYAKYNIKEGDMSSMVAETRRDWDSLEYDGTCPIYSGSIEFRVQIEQKGWNRTVPFTDKYLIDEGLSETMRDIHRRYQKLKRL